MLKECIEIFKENYNRKGERFVTDNHQPKEGTCFFVTMMSGGKWEVTEKLEIEKAKKKSGSERDAVSAHQKWPLLQRLDYAGQLLDMNKPVDPRKIIHSSHCYAFFVKKENLGGKLTAAVLEEYYEILADPLRKYGKSRPTKALYEETEQRLGPPNQEEIRMIRRWVSENLNRLAKDCGEKGYLKLFFVYEDEEETLKAHQRESRRYLLPNLYNSNEYNIKRDGRQLGLPNNNMGMNSKKPFLAHKTRKTEVPWLIGQEDALIQAKFFDYLSGLTARGFSMAAFSPEDGRITAYKNGDDLEASFEGYLLRIQGGKETVILGFDSISASSPNFRFVWKDIAGAGKEGRINRKPPEIPYGALVSLNQVHTLVDQVFFSGFLRGNYCTEPGDLRISDGIMKRSILGARDAAYCWFYRDDREPFAKNLNRMILPLIKNTAVQGYHNKLREQLNLLWSLRDYFSETEEMEETMERLTEQLRRKVQGKEIWAFSDDREYFFMVGQILKYYHFLRNAARKDLSFINAFLNIKSDKTLKEKLMNATKKYAFAVETKYTRLQRTLSNVMLYSPREGVQPELILAGFAFDSLFLEKSGTGRENIEENIN